MAIGDCVSGLHYSAGTAYIYLTPASGEEWVITRVGTDYTSTFFAMEVAGSANYFYNMYGQLRENINAPSLNPQSFDFTPINQISASLAELTNLIRLDCDINHCKLWDIHPASARFELIL